MTNTGNSGITVSAANISNADFTTPGLTLPFTLSAGSSRQITVAFTPAVAGLSQGSISIVSNATISPASVPLSGTGVVPTAHSVDVSWIGSPSLVQGYFVYRSNQSGFGYTKVSPLVGPLAFTDLSVQAGQTYYYVVTALGADGTESGFSNEAPATIPTP